MSIKATTDIDIVDDNKQLCELFMEFAESAGFTAKHFCCTEQYIEYANSDNYTPPNLAVVTDIRMPRKSGYQLMRYIRRINPTQRFVVITGTPEDGIIKDERACHYLAKPVSIERIQAIFHKLASCTNHCNKCQSEPPLCKSLNDLSDFKINDWRCPLEDIALN